LSLQIDLNCDRWCGISRVDWFIDLSINSDATPDLCFALLPFVLAIPCGMAGRDWNLQAHIVGWLDRNQSEIRDWPA
jgi:hypothetical protein